MASCDFTWRNRLWISVVAAGLCVGAESAAQTGVSVLGKRGASGEAIRSGPSILNEHGLSPQTQHGPFQVLHYDLDLHLRMQDEYLSGVVTMTILVTEPTNSLTLNAVSLQLDSVFADGQTVSIIPTPSTEGFAVSLPRSRFPGDTLSLRIVYRRNPLVQRPTSREGYYFFRQNIGIPANLGYTMSEPSDARFWFPCLDEPWAKATAQMRATVPTGYVVASNGRLLGMIDNGDTTVTWTWQEEHKVPPYLMCLTVSAFDISTLPFVRGPGDTIPVQYYTWTGDTQKVTAFLPTVVRMVGALSGRFGPYPFEKYGMTAIVPFAYGGMEHMTITTLNEFLSVDENTVVHELAHQWWGDLVTCASWLDIWLNEGFASYCEALWAEEKGGPGALRDYLSTQFSGFNLASWQGAVYDPAGQGFNLFDAVVYTKAAWVLHALRGVVGDSTFFHILGAYRARFEEGSATTAQFAGIVDSVTGTSMEWFFEQWIYGSGWPRLNANYVWSNGGLLVTIEQIQSSTWPVFRLPMTIRASTTNGPVDFAIVDSLRMQSFALPLSRPPENVLTDPDGWVLKEISGTAGGDRPGDAFTLFQNFPNPFNTTTEIRYVVPVPARVKITLFDPLGREVMSVVDEDRPPGVYAASMDGSHLASGVYFCRLQADRDDGGGRSTLVQKMILLR